MDTSRTLGTPTPGTTTAQVLACVAPVAVLVAMVAVPDGAREPLRWVLYASCVLTVVAVARRHGVVRVLGVVGALGFGGGAAYLHSLADEPSAIPLVGGLAFLLGGVLLVAAACTAAAGRNRRPVLR